MDNSQVQKEVCVCYNNTVDNIISVQFQVSIKINEEITEVRFSLEITWHAMIVLLEIKKDMKS